MVVYMGLKSIRNVCRQVFAAEKPHVYPVVILKQMAGNTIDITT